MTEVREQATIIKAQYEEALERLEQKVCRMEPPHPMNLIYHHAVETMLL